MSAPRSLRIVVLGAGVSGILAAIRLREAGFEDVTIYEKGESVGGTWRENTYPGIACDVPSHMYRYSFAPNPEWSHVYSGGEEIRAYVEGVARRYDLLPSIRFGREITRMEFSSGRWHLTVGTGEQDHADVVIAATGVLHHPNIPAFEGSESFSGALFHSARWDHSVALDGRRVGIIGNGSSGVQIVGALADRVAHLTLFQRTAQWIMPQENPAYSEEEKENFRRHPEAMEAIYEKTSRRFIENFANVVAVRDAPQIKMIGELCLAHLERSITDPELREKLRPDYQAACKRLVISPNFYRAVQRPNVEVVTDPIERFEPGGLRTGDGRLHELDVAVLATGFRVDRFLRPIEVVGYRGALLDERWARRPTAYLSISVPDFPNLFLLNGPNGPVGNFSLIDVAERQFDYILQLLAELRRDTDRPIMASEEATNRFEDERVAAARKTIWMTGCRSWYLDDRGIPAVWPFTFDRFLREMEKPDLRAFERLGPG